MKLLWVSLLAVPSISWAGRSPETEPLFRTSVVWSPPLVTTSAKSQVARSAEFAKVTWFFPERVRVSKVVIESCETPFNDGVDVYVDFERRHLFIEGGQKTLSADLGFIAPEGEELRSLTVNFRHNSPLCLKDIRVLGMDGKVLAGKPKPSVASSSSNETLNLFDSRFDTSVRFASAGGADSPSPVSMKFSAVQAIHRVRVWNGDQSSLSNFREKGRVQRLSFKTDSGSSEVLELKDSTGVQEFKLHPELRGSQLEVQALAAKAGASDSRATLSEIRLAGSDGEIVVSPEPVSNALENENLKLFEEHSLAKVLDQELASGDGKESWSFRFRANGEFYVRGFTDEWKSARSFFAIGTYEIIPPEIIPSTPLKGKGEKPKIKLQLSGFRRPSPNAPDADVCEAACGATEGFSTLPVRDILVIESLGKGLYAVRNRTAKAARGLVFTDVKAQLTSLKD